VSFVTFITRQGWDFCTDFETTLLGHSRRTAYPIFQHFRSLLALMARRVLLFPGTDRNKYVRSSYL
jgi:hypothetical protein